MTAEQQADALRVEVDIALNHEGSFAGQEARDNYLALRAHGARHANARTGALEGTIDTLRSRQQAALANRHARDAANWNSEATALDAWFFSAWSLGARCADARGLT